MPAVSYIIWSLLNASLVAMHCAPAVPPVSS